MCSINLDIDLNINDRYSLQRYFLGVAVVIVSRNLIPIRNIDNIVSLNLLLQTCDAGSSVYAVENAIILQFES